MVENSRLVNMRPTSRWPRVLLVLVVAALLATMTGCGSTGSDPAESPAADSTSGGFPSATASPAPGLPVMELAGEPVVTCREPLGWPVSAMPDGVPGPIEDGELRDIFAGALDGPAGMEFEHVLTDGVDSDYRFLASTDDLVVLGLGAWTTSGPVRGAAWTATLELDGGEWDFLGFGDCQLERQYAEGHARVDVATAERSGPHRLRLGIVEQDCTSGRDPLPYLHEPAVVESEEAVTVYFSSEPVRGGASCQGNPEASYTLELDEPLGDRVLLDGSTYPLRQVRLTR